MQFHRLASLILGVWLGVSVFMDFSASQNFQTVGRVMNSTDIREVETVKKLGGPEMTRFLLHYFAGEANRYLFEQWEWAELLLGLVLFLALLFSRSHQKLTLSLCLLMLIVVAAQRFKLTPMMIAAGRAIEFSDSANRFGVVHQVYIFAELGKLALGLVLAGRLLIRSRVSKRAFVREYERAREVGPPAANR